MRLLLRYIAVAMSILLAQAPMAVPASAATVMVTKVAMSTPPDIVRLTGGIFTNQQVYEGPTTLTFADASTVLAYCVDINHEITLGVQSPSLTYHTDTLANYLSSYSTAVQQRVAGLILTGLTMPFGTGMNPIQGAIWKNFGATVTASTPAKQAVIDAYAVSTVTFDPTKIRVLVNDTHQAFAIIAVPEAATWAMMILGFAFIGVMLRRSSRRPAFRAVLA